MTNLFNEELTQDALSLNTVHEGDCLELMKRIPTGSVDMILCDLPYGTTACKWDTIIPFEPLWAEYERIIKLDGAIVLTASQPFTSVLITSNLKLYKYSWVWQKNNVGGVFNAKNRPLKIYEDIAVFSKAPAANVKGVRMKYFPQGVETTEIVRVNDERRDVETFGERPSRKGSYKQTQTGYPKDILQFDCERTGLHPTQKPVALFEYLIRTYTNEGETVLDNCLGSGTTAVAAINTNRNFIGIERESDYVAIANQRIADALQAKEQAE